jgi:hypothetical protein
VKELYYLRQCYYDEFFIPIVAGTKKELTLAADEIIARMYPSDMKDISSFIFTKESSSRSLVIVVRNENIPAIIKESMGKTIVSGASVFYYSGSENSTIVVSMQGYAGYLEEYVFASGELSECRELQNDDAPIEGSMRIGEEAILSTIATRQSAIDIDGSKKRSKKRKRIMLRMAMLLACISIACLTTISLSRNSFEKRSAMERNKETAAEESQKSVIEKELLTKYIEQYGIGIRPILAEMASLGERYPAFSINGITYRGDGISFTANSGDPVLLTKTMESDGIYENISLSVTDSSIPITRKASLSKPVNSVGVFDISAKYKNPMSLVASNRDTHSLLQDYQGRYWPTDNSSPNEVLSMIIAEFKARNVEINKYKAGEMGSSVVSAQATISAQKLYTLLIALESMRPSVTISRCSIKRSSNNPSKGDVDIDIDFAAYTSDRVSRVGDIIKSELVDDPIESTQFARLFGYKPTTIKNTSNKAPEVPSSLSELGKIVDEKGNTIIIYKNTDTNEVINIKEKANAAN